jgi:peroxiredoxin
MKRLLIALLSGVLFVTILITTGCRDQGRFSVEGTFSVPDSTPVELFLLTEKQSVRVDSVYSKGGTFKLKGSINFAQLFLLRYFNNQTIYLAIQPHDKIKLSIDNSMRQIAYYVENSPDSKLIKDLVDRQNLVLRQIDALSGELETNRADTANRRMADTKYQELMRNHREFTRKFIHDHPRSLADIMALYQNFGRKSQPLFDRYDDLDIFNFVDSNLVALYPETNAVKSLNREITETKQQIAQKKYIEKVVVEGRPLPHLKCIDVQGDSIITGNLYKIPVLLLFWASWNPYSVDELLSLNAYKNSPGAKNIDIITLSLDSSPEKLKTFISKHHITLPVICDYDYWDSQLVARFAVKQIPATLLTDKDGIVTAKNRFSDELLNLINEAAR